VILALVSPRVLFVIGGVGAIVVWAVARVVFARSHIAEEAVTTDVVGGEPTAIAALEAHR
jgi:hypothetical protein